MEDLWPPLSGNHSQLFGPPDPQHSCPDSAGGYAPRQREAGLVGPILDRSHLRWAFGLLGVMESENWPAAIRIIARTMEPRERAFGNGHPMQFFVDQRSELRQAEESPQPQAWSSSVKSGGQTAGMSTLCHYVTMNALSVLLPLKKGAARIDGGREAPRLSFTLDVGTTTTPEGFAFFPPFLHGGTLGTQSVTFLPSTNPRAAPTSSINSARYPCLSSPLPASARSSTLPRVAFPL